jgi:hypothetical protein
LVCCWFSVVLESTLIRDIQQSVISHLQLNKLLNLFRVHTLMEVENGIPVCLPHRKKSVKDLFLNRASTGSVIRYPEIYRIFEDDKSELISELTWRGCVWETVEEVCSEISTLRGAIYYSMLSNRNGVPEDVFWSAFRINRKEEYEEDTGNLLPGLFEELTLDQKKSVANYERSRVYRHYNKYHRNKI